MSIAGFDLLVALLAEAKSELWNKEEEFPERVGITSEEYGSLQDELILVRYGPLGYPRPRDSQTGGPWGPTEPRRTGTAWDRLPKMEAEVLAGRESHLQVVAPLSITRGSACCLLHG